MTSSATQDFLSDVIDGERVPPGKLAYFQTRLAANVHQAMLKLFARLERDRSFTRRELAQRIGRKPEQITRWFSYPGNLTLGTVSDIFVGMGYELESISLVNLATGERTQCPDHHVDWAWLAGLYAHEQESAVSPVSESSKRGAISNQSRRYGSIAELISSDQSTQHGNLHRYLPSFSGLGKAAAAQLQTTGTRPSGTQIGIGQQA
jgi:hypothetical protein